MLRSLAPRTLTHISLCAAALVSIGGLWAWFATTAFSSLAAALPIGPSTLLLLLPCIIALLALELRLRIVALVLSSIVTVLMGVIIAGWVMHQAPLLGYSFFVAPNAPLFWFPSPASVGGATAVAQCSLVVLLLSIPRLQPLSGPIAWAAGISMVGSPLLQGLSQIPATSGPFNWMTAALWLTVLLAGLGLLTSHAVRSTPKDWGARTRALAIIVAMSSTLILWQTVHAEEIRQLRGDVEAALADTMRDIRERIAERTTIIERLGVHFASAAWQPPIETFVADARIFLRDYPAGFAVFVTDSAAQVRYAAYRDAPLLGESSTENTVKALDIADIAAHFADRQTTLPMNAGRLEIAARSIQTGEPIRAEALPAPTDRRITIASHPLFDAGRKPLGAVVIVLRTDINTRDLLKNAAPEFDLRVGLDGVPTYARIGSPPATALGEQFRLRTDRKATQSRFDYDLTPGPRVIERNLTPIPTLVLLFAWASLVLLSFALYNERRAQNLSRERERILNQSLDIICTLDADGRYVSINEAVQRVLGYAPSELLGRHF